MSKKVQLLIYISEELNEKLRKSIPMKKGELSKFVEQAIKEKLENMEKQQSPGF
ncbi:MAG: hypothetical protein QW607_12375 [Desulfurococcaceae archaeon]